MYKMEFNIKEKVCLDGDRAQLEETDVLMTVCAPDGRVYMECGGVALVMTPTQAKDLMFSLRKAVYEAQRETRNTKKYPQKGGVR
jgi:hypothetical protein